MDKINLARLNKVQQTIFIDMDYTTWDYMSASSFVWQTDVFSKDFILEPSERLDFFHRNRFSMMQTQAKFSSFFFPFNIV